MYYRTIIIGCLLCLALGTTAQALVGLRFGAGFPAIANQNNYGQSELVYKIRVNPVVQGVVGYNLLKDREIQIRFSYHVQGQSYESTLRNITYAKDVVSQNVELSAVYKLYISELFNVDEKFYMFGGPRVNALLSVDHSYKLNGQEVAFFEYAFNEGHNRNEDLIRRIGSPEDDQSFYESFDFGLFGGFGYEKEVASNFYFVAEITASMGITDINAEPWRLKNIPGKYGPSRNFIGTIQVGFTSYLGFRGVPPYDSNL